MRFGEKEGKTGIRNMFCIRQEGEVRIVGYLSKAVVRIIFFRGTTSIKGLKKVGMGINKKKNLSSNDEKPTGNMRNNF